MFCSHNLLVFLLIAGQCLCVSCYQHVNLPCFNHILIISELWVVKKQPQLIGSDIQSAFANRAGAWNRTISVPLPNFGDNRKVFVKVIERDIADLQQYQALCQQQQQLSQVQSNQQHQQNQQLSQQHFQQQQQLNQHQFNQQQQLNQQQNQQQQQQCLQQQIQQQCLQQQLQGQRMFGQNLTDNVLASMCDSSMFPMHQQLYGNSHLKLLDTADYAVDSNIYVRVPPSEFLNMSSGGMLRNINPASAFFKVLDPSMIAPRSGITQNQVFFKVFDSDLLGNRMYGSPLDHQQGARALLLQKTLADAELQQLRQNIRLLDRDMLIDTPTLGGAASRILHHTAPFSLLGQQHPIQAIDTCAPYGLGQQLGNVFLNQGMNRHWSTLPVGQAYSSDLLGNLRLRIALEAAEALKRELIHQQQGDWIAVNPARHQVPMFLNITVENPLRSRL